MNSPATRTSADEARTNLSVGGLTTVPRVLHYTTPLWSTPKKKERSILNLHREETVSNVARESVYSATSCATRTYINSLYTFLSRGFKHSNIVCDALSFALPNFRGLTCYACLFSLYASFRREFLVV